MAQATDAMRGSVQITLPQQVTVRTLPLLERQIDDAIARRSGGVELLCAGVQIVDSAGLNWLVTALSRLETAGIALKLMAPSAILADVLMATRLESRFVIPQAAAAPPPSGLGDNA